MLMDPLIIVAHFQSSQLVAFLKVVTVFFFFLNREMLVIRPSTKTGVELFIKYLLKSIFVDFCRY